MADDTGVSAESLAGANPDASMRRVSEGLALVEAAERIGVTLRLLGGVGVFLHCRDASAPPHRTIRDIDAAVLPKQGKQLEGILADQGYLAERRFNALHGDTRLLFEGPTGKLDVFVGTFAMCHRLDLTPRLALDSPTIPVSDLLATKLQVVRLTNEDVQDIALLLRRHEIGDGPDSIDPRYLAQLTAADWGLWRSATASLEQSAAVTIDVQDKAGALRRALDNFPKSRRWRLRDRIGDRVQWYETPGEVT